MGSSSNFRYKAIAFDFDGVLVESIEVKDNAFYKIYLEFGESVASKVLEHHRTFRGPSRYEKFKLYHKEFLGVDLSTVEVETFAQRFSKIVEDEVANAPYVKGAFEFLHKNGARIPLFVTSTTPHDELLRILKRRGIDGFFRKAWGHPNKKVDVLNEILRDLKLEKSQLLMVGDAISDLKAAQAAGVPFLGRKAGPAEFPEGTPLMNDLRELEQNILNK